MAILGIDLGTTNSCAALIRGGKPIVIRNDEGRTTTPSVLTVGNTGQWIVGDPAKRAAITNATRTATCTKRLLGRPFDTDEVALIREAAPFSVRRAVDGESELVLDDTILRAEQVSAAILAKLKAAAEAQLGEEIRDAVITVPAYFDDRQRRATKDAARIAGLQVRRLLNEPTAATLYYGLRNNLRDGSIVAVYDLGGGTFDVAVLEVDQGVFQVRATAGDCFLGGEDFDTRMVAWLTRTFQEQTGITLDLRADPSAHQRLRDAAERAKVELSSLDEAQVHVPFLAHDESGPRHLDCVVTRYEFEALVRDLVERTIELCAMCLQDAGVDVSEVDDLILVGGQTRTPLVEGEVTQFFDKSPLRCANPDEVVALGAAVQAGVIEGQLEEQLLVDVIPLSLGVEVAGGLVAKLLDRNMVIPTRATRIFTTTEDDQDSVRVHVVQGERELAVHNRSLGIFELYGIPPLPRGLPQIEVGFQVSQDGTLTVSARERTTGREQRIRISGGGGLTPSELERMLRASQEHRNTDRDHKRRIELETSATTLLKECRRELTDPVMQPAQDRRELLEAALRELERARAGALPIFAEKVEALAGALYRGAS